MNPRILAVLIAAALSTAGCGGLDEREEESHAQSLAALERGDWSIAGDLARTVLEGEPDYGPAHLVLGRALFELGKEGDALEAIGRAEEKGGLDPEQRFTAILYRGRCHLELGRKKDPDPEPESEAAPRPELKEARDLFIKANSVLTEASSLHPGNYDANLWRGYAVLRLENYRKAIEILKECASSKPEKWEHRFFMALAWEGLYKVNTQSMEAYLAITAQGPRAEHAPLYDHLTRIIQLAGDDTRRRMHTAIQAYAKAVPGHSARIESYLAEAALCEAAERRQAKLRSTSEKVQTLIEKSQFREAVAAVESFLRDDATQPNPSRMVKDAGEGWSLLLEARVESLLGSGEKEKLETALQCFELARKLTSKVDRLVVLQQKINVVELGLARDESSRKIQRTHDLLKAGKHAEVLASLSGLSVEGLTTRDRDLYHYLRGVASYHLGQLAPAARSFAAMAERHFDGIDAFQGISLVRSGQETAGVAMLAGIPSETRGDEVNRLLGIHLFEKDAARAVAYLAAVKNPAPADLELHLKARRKLGQDAYDKGDYPRAVEEFQAARQILEVQLHKRVFDVYLTLGNAYFRMEDFERAKKTYQDLAEADLTQAEREQCRDIYLHRGQIHLREKNPDLAYKDFAEFIRLRGQMPGELSNMYGRLVAMYADFLPLDRIQYWNYTSTAKDYNYTLFVKGEQDGVYRVERREAGSTSEEAWSRQGIHVVKRMGDAIVKLPLNVNPAEDALPYVEYASQGQECAAEIVAIQQTVEIPGGRKYTDCLKVRSRKTLRNADGTVRSTKYILYFAPGVGEVKQEVYRDDAKVSEIVLSDFAYRSGDSRK